MKEWVLTTSELNEYVRKQLAGDPLLRSLKVRGELTGFKRHFSGHLYFQLKDDKARVQCVMFRQYAQALDFEPRDGMQVTLAGSASLYPATGSFQVYCEQMTALGAGELYLKFEALKAKLSREGLFDAARKRPIPMLPRVVGLVTSRSGAALRDMVRVITRRYPGMRILLCAAQVQGAGAAQELARALERLNQDARADVILLGRGGGSIEDLWAFNEEVLARAIAASRIPVISCVGHETDFTIADFVSDMRAATPSMAAEMAVPVKAELMGAVNELRTRMKRTQLARLRLIRARLARLARPFAQPQRALIAPKRLALRNLVARMDAALRQRTLRARATLSANARALRAMGTRALSAPKRARVCALEARMTFLMRARCVLARHRIEKGRQALEALSPERVLERGYALVTDAQGKAPIGARDLRIGLDVGLRMKGGRASARITQVEGEERTDGGQEKADV
ncbi:MAG: exodeoxyribonuclease VII large subunit [Clostridia bacterium]